MSPEGPTAVPVDLWNLMAEERHQRRDTAQLPSLGLHRVVHVAQVLQVRRGIRLQGGTGWGRSLVTKMIGMTKV